ncbi:MAG: radical SAM protein [Acidobacteriota bacterium]|nr:radical SAM protein [Acidobacteriota bacterium]
MQSEAATGASEHRLPAPVDLLVPERGLRLRHLPGQVCLASRRAFAPAVSPDEGLLEDIARCLAGDPSHFLVARLRPTGGEAPPCAGCSTPTIALSVDAALGEASGLVVEGLSARWCRSCGELLLPDAVEQLRPRLEGFEGAAGGEAVPSLIYETPGHPRSVQLEVSTRCNLTCSYCSHRHLESKRFQPFEEFLRHLDGIDFHRVRNVDFTGLGEPVLHPRLPDMVREVRRRAPRAEVRVVTNGTVFDARRFEPLCAAGITSIAFSLDSLDPQRFAHQRGGTALQPVLDNLEALVEHRRRQNLDHLRIKIKAVLVDDPYADAEALLSYSAHLGLRMPHFSCIDPRSTAQESYDETWLEEGWDGGDEAFLRWSEDRWRQLTGEAPIPASPVLSPEHDEILHPAIGPPPELCRWAVDAAYLTIDGSSLTCCEAMIDLPRRPLAQLDGSSLAELWIGDLLWGYRLPLALGWLPPGCVGCPQAPAHGRPLTEPGEPLPTTGAASLLQIGSASRPRQDTPPLDGNPGKPGR